MTTKFKNGLAKHSSGTYHYCLRINGRQYKGSTRATDLQTARKVLEERRRQFLQTDCGIRKVPTLSEVREVWLRSHKAVHSPKHWREVATVSRLWLITVFTIIAAAGTVAISDSSEWIVKASNDELIALAQQSVATEMGAIGLELDQLAWCLQEYKKQAGSETVVAFYKRRYLAVTCWIDAIHSLDSCPNVQAVFAPRDSRQTLLPEGATK